MPGSCLVALLCTLSTASIMLFLYGDHIHEAYSKWDLTKLLYRGTKFTPFSDTNDLLITAIIPHALLMLMLIPRIVGQYFTTRPSSLFGSVRQKSAIFSLPVAIANLHNLCKNYISLKLLEAVFDIIIVFAVRVRMPPR